MSDLQRAWKWREERGLFEESQVLRVFHGPGEATGPLSRFAVDRFSDHYWITRWEKEHEKPQESQKAIEQILGFLVTREAASVVGLWRPEKGVPERPHLLHGTVSSGRFEVREGPFRFWIQLQESRHPGLFLDHFPLRLWLRRRAREWKVLNTFSYTGSLSVASGVGGASHVTTLDLAKPAVQWAEENWKLNGLASDRARFIDGDVFEWLPRLKREGERYDCVILDPPSFSRGKKGTFSTSKDLSRLHALAIDVLVPGGVIVTSINSAQVSWGRYEQQVLEAARSRKRSFEVLSRVDLPETFPTRFGSDEDRYLKGWILRES